MGERAAVETSNRHSTTNGRAGQAVGREEQFEIYDEEANNDQEEPSD